MRLDASLDRISELIACPACHQPLAATGNALRCTACGRLYPIEDGLPILLIDRATLPTA
jgi:hypothetical protein